MIEQELRGLVKEATGSEQVHWLAAPDRTILPHVILSIPSTVRDHSMDGPSELFDSVVQIDVWATSYSESADLRDDILSIDGFTGTDSIMAIMLESCQTGIDTSSNERIYRQMMRFRIFHTA